MVRRGQRVGWDWWGISRDRVDRRDGLSVWCDGQGGDWWWDHEWGRGRDRIWSGRWSCGVEGHTDNRGIGAELGESFADWSSEQRGKMFYHGSMRISQPSAVMLVRVHTINMSCEFGAEHRHVGARNCFDRGRAREDWDGRSAGHFFE